MGEGSSPAVVEQLRALFRLGAAAGLSDGQLLERFVDGPDDLAEAAFAALVERHGPMVLRVGRQVLGDPHDAEDAAQAAFLVLARKARSIRRMDSVASWLYGVAARIAARARADAARRRSREHRGAEMAARLVERPGDGPESWPELHEELGRLPERLRRPIVLCHLEGLNHRQAAEQLGCPVRTVQSRLARGRERLRARLARRGLGPAIGLLVASDASAAAPPEAWTHATVKAAVRYAAGGAGAASVSTTVAALTEGALRAMMRDTLKAAATAAVLLGLALGGLGLAARSAPTAPEDGPRYRATFEGGAAVEVVGISDRPSDPTSWWAPDGSPLEMPAYAFEGKIDEPERPVRTVLVRVSGVRPGDVLKWLPSYEGSYWGGGPTQGGRRVPGLDFYTASFPRGRDTCTVQVRLATGPWTIESSHGGGGSYSTTKGGLKFYFGKAREYRGGTAISIAQNIVGRDLRVVAIDHDGRVHEPVSSSGAGGEILSLLDVEFTVPPDRLRTYAVQSRPFALAEIRDIALHPRGAGATPKAPVEPPTSAPPRSDDPAAEGRPPALADKDSDGDGLSDYQEVHKYRTDPTKLSTAGDGVSDGDWSRRREFTYTVRSVVKVMPPVNLDSLNDDYQDARVLSRGDGFVELEVIHYPLNTNAEAIRGNPDWRRDAPALADDLRPGLTTNWDDAMRRDLVAALKADGIDPDRLDDKELVVRAARWLFAHSQFTNMFCTHYVHFPEGKAAIYPGLEARFEADRGRPSWTTQEQLDRELFGRSMFAHRTHGTCTSSAVYLTTALRALGIPTRMVLAIPVVDGNDEQQVAMVRDGIHHHRVREQVLTGLASARGYVNHTFNEVFVGGRWVRLNYGRIGQDILDAGNLGLMTHVNTFRDLSEAGLAATWGKRYALGERDDLFRTSNPYRAEAVSDHFGRFARVDNPPEAGGHRAITLSRAYWADAPDSSDSVRGFLGRGRPGTGHVVVHGEEWIAGRDHLQYKVFMQAADKRFRFRAEGHPDVLGTLTMSFVTHESAGLREMEIVLAPEEFARMKAGVEYTLVPENGVPGYEWKTKGNVTIRRP